VSVGEVFHQLSELDPVPFGLLEKLEGDEVGTELGCLRDLTSVRTGDLLRRDGLADDEEVLDLSNDVGRDSSDGVPGREEGGKSRQYEVERDATRELNEDSPDDEEVGGSRRVAEKRSFDEVVVESRLSLSGIDGSEGTVGRLVGRFEDEGFSEVEL